MSKHSILLVDDSLNLLKALNRTFKGESYIIFTATNAKDGFKILENEHIDLVISDQNMPEISGIEFLKVVKIKYPETIRIMLTGETDFEVAKDAINKGEIYRFFNKPCNDFELKISVKYALAHKELERENRKLREKLIAKEEILKHMESKFPGITSKDTLADGSIVIDG